MRDFAMGMAQDEPVTRWISQLAASEKQAAEPLWKHFCGRLLKYTSHRLQAQTKRVYDEEDVANSAFRSLCRGIESNRFPEIDSRENLWALLVVIAGRKISNRHRYDAQQKRQSAKTIADVALVASEGGAKSPLDLLPSYEPSPALAAEVADTSEHLLSMLPEDDLKRIVLMKLEGFTNDEVAERLNVTRRTVQRKLERIRAYWLCECEAEVSDDS